MNTSSPEGKPATAAPPGAGLLLPRGPSRLPIIFVSLSLLSLLIVPQLLNWRADRLRREIGEGADPIRAEITSIEAELARQVAGVRGFLASGDSSLLATASQAEARRAHRYTGVAPLARRLDPEVDRALADLRARDAVWAQATRDLLAGRLSREEYIKRLPQQQVQYEATLTAVATLDHRVGEATRMRRQRIANLYGLESLLTAVLALLALASTYLLVRLDRRLMAQTSQLRRRAHEEEALREVARSLTVERHPSEMLRRVVESALFVADADGAFVEHLDEARREVEVVAAAGSGPPRTGTKLAYPGSLTEQVISRDEPELISDIRALNHPLAEHIDGTAGPITALVVPLISEEAALGALLLLRRAERGAFRGDEISRSRTLADMAAVGLRRVLLAGLAERRTRDLEESERRFRLLIESVEDYAIFMLDPDGCIASWNRGAELLTGYTAAEVLGQHFRLFYAVEERQREHPEHELEVAATHGRYSEDGWRVRKDGTCFWAEVTLSAVHDEAGALLGFAKVTHDLTVRKRAESEREALLQRERLARTDAEAAGVAKSQFLATMSHEIRTPINAIIGYTELLQMGIGGPLTPKQEDQLARVRRSSQHLLGLINDILDLSKIEAGGMTVQASPMPLRSTALGALELVRPQAEAKGLDLGLEMDCGENVRYVGDVDRVRQILVNLLSNAVKFTEPPGWVALRCQLADSRPDGSRLQGAGPWLGISVEDAGQGIAAEQITRVFEPFVQADQSSTRKVGGTGLGLTISRRFARLMAGDLTVRSEPGQGSCFTLWLPTADTPRAWHGDDGFPTRPRQIPGLSEVGHLIAEHADTLTRTVADRLRSDLLVPSARTLDRAQLEDHMATFLLDIGKSLITLDEGGGEPGLMRDGSDIQQLISRRHGDQRLRLGWTESELQREFALLSEELHRLLEGEAAKRPDATLGAAREIVDRLLERAEQICLGSYDRAELEA